MSLNLINRVDGSTKLIAGSTLYADAPIGTISPFGGSVVPSGYLLCNGAEVLKTDYAELYTVIGDAFGTASDNTKFVLPDFRESVPVGAGESDRSDIANHDTYDVGEFKNDQLQTHTHGAVKVNGVASIGVVGDPSWTESTLYSASISGAANNTISLSAGNNSGRSGTTTHGKQLGVNYIIKAKQIAVPADFIDAVDDAVVDIIKDTTVDAVTNGDMNPVTSNAVAKEIQPLKKSYVLESGVFTPTVIAGNDHINTTIQLQHTYSFGDIMFMLTPVTYTNTAFITVSGHWGGNGESSEGWTQSDKITVFVTNLYSQSQTAGFYWAVYGTEDNIVS